MDSFAGLLEEAREHYVGQLLVEEIARALNKDDVESLINDNLKEKIARIDALLATGGWIEQQDIPNVDAQNVFERDIGKPLVTRSKTGKWYLHAPLPPLPGGKK